MATKLKGLSVTSVDLVDRGANPDAHIRLFKRKDAEPEQDMEPNEGLLQKIAARLAKILSDGMASMPPPIGDSSVMKPQVEAKAESLSADQEQQGEKEETDTMKIDKSKMTPEEQATLAEFEKKYGIAEPGSGEGEPAPDDGVTKSAGTPDAAQQTTPAPDSSALHPEVAKALTDFQAFTKQQAAEIEALKKGLEIERLTAAAQKFEVLGKKAPELAEKLYELKKAGGTVYDDYVALLDESVSALAKSGLFNEIGSSRQGSAGTEQTLGIKAAELAKSAQGGMTSTDAIIKAWEENPELAAQYEAEYFGG